jgi:hypothetical protein
MGLARWYEPTGNETGATEGQLCQRLEPAIHRHTSPAKTREDNERPFFPALSGLRFGHASNSRADPFREQWERSPIYRPFPGVAG